MLIRTASFLDYIIIKHSISLALRDGIMARPRPTARRPLRLLVTALASGLAATVLTGCVLNKPPNAAEVKDLALYGLQPPAQWATGSAPPLAPPWTTGSPGSTTMS